MGSLSHNKLLSPRQITSEKCIPAYKGQGGQYWIIFSACQKPISLFAFWNDFKMLIQSKITTTTKKSCHILRLSSQYYDVRWDGWLILPHTNSSIPIQAHTSILLTNPKLLAVSARRANALADIPQTNTYAVAHRHTHTDPDRGISCGAKMGASAVHRAREKGQAEFAGSEKEKQNWLNKTARAVEDPTVDIIVPERSACWQGRCVENKDTVWMGRDRETYKYCAGEHSIAHLRDKHPCDSQWLYLCSGILAWTSPSSSPGTVGPSLIDCPTSRWQSHSSTGHSSGRSPGPLPGCVLPTCAGSTGLKMATVR